MNDTQPIILAAGGTGGHIFPAQALAEELLAHDHPVMLMTDRRFIDYSGAHQDGVFGTMPIHYVHAASMGGGVVRKLRGGLSIVYGIWQARRVLKKLKPKAVVGFGGYPSFPTMMAAAQLGIPTVIHEQNSVLGKANRMLCERVRRIATSYEKTERMPESCVSKTVLTGNPVRAAIRALHAVPYPQLQDDATLRILVTGGSQGANIFADVVPQAIRALPEAVRLRLRVDQQCRKEDVDKVRQAYREMNMAVDIAPFFTDMPARLASAHLVIGRSGASTVAELTCAGRPAILVPYPGATDQHQYHNAQAVEDAGGGWVMPQEGFTAEALSARLESFLSLPVSLNKAATKMKAVGKIDAARDLMQVVLEGVESSG